MSTTTAPEGHRRRRRPLGTPAVLVIQSLAVVLLLAGAGLAAGYGWSRLWDPPRGVVRSGQWFTDETGLRADFSGTGLYIVVGAVVGLACGVLVGLLLARWEVLTLVVLLLASALAGWIMWRTGTAQGPPDPQVLARDAADGTRLPGDLHVSGRAPFVAFPLGALLGYAVLLISVPGRSADDEPGGRHRDADRPDDEEMPPRGTGARDQSSHPTFSPGSPG